MALKSTQPLTEMSTRNIFVGCKGCQCVCLTAFPPSRADCLEKWTPQSPGILRACPCLYRVTCFLLGPWQGPSFQPFTKVAWV